MASEKQTGIKFIGGVDRDELFSKEALAANTDASGNFYAGAAGRTVTEAQKLDRIELLSDEVDANDEENCAMQSEIDEQSPVLTWLFKARNCGVPDVEQSARILIDYYQGI